MADDSSGENIDSKNTVSSSKPSNEDVIEELTKDLASSSVKSVDPSVSSKCDEGAAKLNTPLSDKDILEDFDQSDDETNASHEEDFIDEEALKIAESSLSEEKKETLRCEADELKLKGNNFFKNGEFQESADSYTLALRTCPLTFSTERAVLYSNRAAAKMKLNLQKSAVCDCSKAIELNPTYLKAYFRRAQLYEGTEKLEEALADYKKILELDPSHQESYVACNRLPDQINERNEKLKTEMMGKLKDLGNMILRPFGLSTNNFQLNQDPSSGGYSINFKQNTE